MTSKTRRSLRRLAPLALVLVAIAIAACGSNSSSTTSAAPASSGSSGGAAATTTSSGGGGATTAGSTGIPQGPGAGDNDADNQGGPSDGDGNI